MHALSFGVVHPATAAEKVFPVLKESSVDSGTRYRDEARTLERFDFQRGVKETYILLAV